MAACCAETKRAGTAFALVEPGTGRRGPKLLVLGGGHAADAPAPLGVGGHGAGFSASEAALLRRLDHVGVCLFTPAGSANGSGAITGLVPASGSGAVPSSNKAIGSVAAIGLDSALGSAGVGSAASGPTGATVAPPAPLGALPPCGEGLTEPERRAEQLTAICGALGLGFERVCVIATHPLDTPMLLKAGFAFALEGAGYEARAAADRVFPPRAEGGLEEALRAVLELI